MAPLRFGRVPSRPLSLWQSAVADFARQQLENTNNNVSQTMVMQHPMVGAAAEHVTATYSGHPPTQDRNLAIPHQLNVYLSHLCYERVKAELSGDIALADYLGITYRQYSDKDPGFLSCATTYAQYWAQYGGTFCYNDWTIQGGGNFNYGVIAWQLPKTAIVAIIGDWGTGLDDAIAMVKDMLLCNPDAIIHLGDIYYSGTPSECQTTFIQALASAGAANIPVFTLPGNHDYYALGYGFYPMLQQLNTNIPGAQQEASYFCLRTEDGGYQFLGMDTGRHDANPGDQFDPTYAGPWLEPSEIAWHQDKLNNFNGNTILLSHHQLFSTNAKLNGSVSAYAGLPYLNPYLYQPFWPYLQTKVAGWLWGHEHNFALYQYNLLQLQQGILVGCSAYEELTSANPYQQNYSQIPYDNPPNLWELGTNTDPNGVGYYNHAYAVIYFGFRENPTDPVLISYFQFPSWGPDAPANPTSSLLLEKSLSAPNPQPKQPVQYGDILQMFCQEGLFISPLYYQLAYNYPTATTNNPVDLQLVGSSGTVNHGDILQIQTDENAAGNNNLLGAWATPTLYYYSGNYTQLQWQIFKKDTSAGTQVNYGDEVYFVNMYYIQWLTIYWSRVYGNIYLTTKAGANYYWQLQMPVMAKKTTNC